MSPFCMCEVMQLSSSSQMTTCIFVNLTKSLCQILSDSIVANSINLSVCRRTLEVAYAWALVGVHMWTWFRCLFNVWLSSLFLWNAGSFVEDKPAGTKFPSHLPNKFWDLSTEQNDWLTNWPGNIRDLTSQQDKAQTFVFYSKKKKEK